MYQRALAATTAALLAVDAYVHLRNAGLYDAIATPTLSQGTLFREQAAVAAAVAVTLVLRPHPLVWAIAVLVAASAAAAVLLTPPSASTAGSRAWQCPLPSDPCARRVAANVPFSRTIPVALASSCSVAPCRAAARTLNTPVPAS
jgi:hypothetical protein